MKSPGSNIHPTSFAQDKSKSWTAGTSVRINCATRKASLELKALLNDKKTVFRSGTDLS